mgnify:CR=1 FL=1
MSVCDWILNIKNEIIKIKKKGASYDLPIALSVLEAVGNIPAKALERVLVAGELPECSDSCWKE